MKIIVSFSGGKDSQACLIEACKEFGNENVIAVFCDTGWEHKLTYKHVNDVTTQLGVRLVILKNEKIGGFESLCKRMKWFPNTQHRMCTVQLKIQPMIDYILKHDDDLIIIQGIRAIESAVRSKMPCSANYFQEYLDTDNKKRLYRKTDVLKWCENHTAMVERPMMNMNSQSVIDFIIQNGQQPNPLYRQGASRVGCYPCIFAKLSEIKNMRHNVEYVLRVVKLEEEVNRLRVREDGKTIFASLFSKGKIPARYCYKYGNGIPAFEDVISYVSRNDTELELFEKDEMASCMSVYHGLCE